jgi:hypothetical protein
LWMYDLDYLGFKKKQLYKIFCQLSITLISFWKK